MIIEGFKGEIESDAKARAKYSRDASLFKVVPQAAVFPRDASDVKTLVRFVNANAHLGISLTARAAGTDMSGGPLTESIVVDFTRHMNVICQIGYGTAITEPGVLYRDFEKALTAHEFLLPSYTASKDLCAVGGMVANNSGGEKTLRYGKTADIFTLFGRLIPSHLKQSYGRQILKVGCIATCTRLLRKMKRSCEPQSRV
jgi:FAD/FMN-containing dehydrogenase